MSIIYLLAAFGGGVFGALISGVVSFIFTGLVALVGFSLLLATGDGVFLDQIAFGPFFGPHVAFSGAVAAAAYAGRKGLMDGSDVTHPLFAVKNPVSLLIGGGFGVLGYLVNYLLVNYTGIKIDTVAVTVLLLNIIARLVISNKSIMAPTISESEAVTKNMLFDTIWALGLSLVVAFVVIETGLPNFGWAISAISLIFLFTKASTFPATHHVTMVAGYAAITFGNIYIAAIFGIIAVVMGEIVQKYTNTKVKSHIDMPAVVIAILSAIILPFA